MCSIGWRTASGRRRRDALLHRLVADPVAAELVPLEPVVVVVAQRAGVQVPEVVHVDVVLDEELPVAAGVELVAAPPRPAARAGSCRWLRASRRASRAAVSASGSGWTNTSPPHVPTDAGSRPHSASSRSGNWLGLGHVAQARRRGRSSRSGTGTPGPIGSMPHPSHQGHAPVAAEVVERPQLAVEVADHHERVEAGGVGDVGAGLGQLVLGGHQVPRVAEQQALLAVEPLIGPVRVGRQEMTCFHSASKVRRPCRRVVAEPLPVREGWLYRSWPAQSADAGSQADWPAARPSGASRSSRRVAWRRSASTCAGRRSSDRSAAVARWSAGFGRRVARRATRPSPVESVLVALAVPVLAALVARQQRQRRQPGVDVEERAVVDPFAHEALDPAVQLAPIGPEVDEELGLHQGDPPHLVDVTRVLAQLHDVEAQHPEEPEGRRSPARRRSA